MTAYGFTQRFDTEPWGTQEKTGEDMKQNEDDHQNREDYSQDKDDENQNRRDCNQNHCINNLNIVHELNKKR